MISKTAVVLALCMAYVASYPIGAPEQACAKLGPIHKGAMPQNTTAPYTIEVNANEWSPYGMIKVMVKATGNETINGFILQAKKQSDGSGLGMFNGSSLPDKTKLGPCTLPGSTDMISVTHSDPSAKGDLTFMWRGSGAENYDGKIYFQGAVAVDHDMFWVDIMSNHLTKAPGTTATKVITTASTTPSAGSMPTASLLLLIASVMFYLTK